MTTENIETLYALSPMQRGMLFHTLYAPQSGIYIGQFVCRLEGNLDTNLFYTAWQHIVQRHPPLRTAFLWEDMDEPLQVVYRSRPLPWQQHNWSTLSTSERRKALEALLTEDRNQGFEMNRAPLMRLTLLHVSDESSYFVCTHHHILLDGWSLTAVLQEVFSLYEALRDGRQPVLKQRRPFQDYISWLRQRRQEEAEAFWRAYLSGFTAPTPLLIPDLSWQEVAVPQAHDARDVLAHNDELLRDGLQAGRPVRLSGFTFAVEEAEALRHYARSSQLTVNTLFQGAWALLLSRYSGEKDVVFGVTVAGRPGDLPGSEQMIGLFINTLPVRVQVPPHADLTSWLKQLQTQQVETRQYDYSPLVQIQGWSEVPRDLPLFESLFVFENYPLDAASDEQESLRITAVQSLEQTNYPLVLVVGITGTQGLKVQLGYEIARFSEAAIERVHRQLRKILTQMIHHPAMRLADISLLMEEEQQHLLATWRGTQTHSRTEHEETLTIIDLLKKQALHTPERVALVCGDCAFTYGELDRRSNQLAHHLLCLGLRDEASIGVCLDRSGELAIALLGILKAGTLYLPFASSLPRERIAFMLSETQTSLMLTQTTYLELFSPLNVQTLCLDRDCLTHVCTEPPSIALHPAQAAYVIYTSGSTGQPKGVVVSHQALLNHALAVGTAYDLREQERVLQFASISFDVSLEELLPTWVHGASVVMWSEPQAPSPSEFSTFIAREALNVLNLPSSYWHEWVLDLARTQANLPSDLRALVIGSERALAARLALWQRVVGERVTVYNAYGLTETTITALVHTPGWISPQEETRALPVGRPLANIEAYVLDEHLWPVPPGVPGELYIGGMGLGRGYLGHPALTAERFLPYPFDGVAGARLYRTGDRARYLPGGDFELLGRNDAQVKIRGFRIEPAEIEARLLQYPAVSEALVLAHEDTPGEVALVAYIVVDEQGPALIANLRQHLQESLPPYMIPAFFVPLDALPRTAGGKVNLQRLPSPQQKLTQADTYIPPRTPIEEILAASWCEVLKLERVGRTDHFFRLGGHSLQATQVVARLRETLRIELPVRAIYDHPTIAALAALIEQKRQQIAGQQLPAIEPVGREAPLPLSFAQQRLWFLDQFQPGNPFYTIPGIFYLRGSLDVASLEHSLQNLIQRHESLRTTFELRNGEPVQIIAPTLSLSLPVIQLVGTAGLTWSEETITLLAREEGQQPFDLERGPLIRAMLIRMNAQEHVLLLALHHIIADGWSMEILLQELSIFYTANFSGQPVALSQLPIQYADYAVWQRSWLEGHVLEQQLAYWQRQLAGAPTLLALPTDRPRPAVQTYNGAIYTFHLSPTLTRRLHGLSREEGVTLFMVLLAAFQVLLYRYSNQSDIVVGTPTSGRVHRATEGVVGLFLNMLALRVQVSANLTYHDLLQKVRNVTLEAYMHQDIPFEKLVEKLQPERSLSHGPLFQVMLTLQNTPVGAIAMPGLSLEAFGGESRASKFDLTLGLHESSSGLQCVVEYSTDLFDEITIARMAGHFQTLLEGCAANPQLSLAELPLLTLSERQQVLLAWNTHSVELSTHCVHHIVEAKARAVPDALALTFAEEQLTYAGLDQRANQLAHYLQTLGIGPDVLVGLFLSRSIDQLVGILAVLKAGGAYVPLDPNYPQERLAFMLEDAAVVVLLTHKALRPELPACPNTTTVYLDSTWRQISCYPHTAPITQVQPEHLAYMIYTSGSTGRPKGVMVTHRSVCNLAQAQTCRFAEEANARAIQWISLSFDASLSEIMTTWQAGATLCLGDREQLQQSEHLLAFLEENAITTLTIPPSVLALLPHKTLPHVRTIVVGAEPFSGELVARWSEGRHFFNAYGPTEATVSATVAECCGAEQPSIGHPLANVQVYLLDSQLQPVPVGLPGELYIGGMGVSRGYHRYPELTAERFIPHPFNTVPGKRLYRTGDLACYLPDGSIRFLGRVDRQVKVRGYRIEPGEIEAHLDQHPAIRSAVVVVREDTPGDQQLVAYIVTEPQSQFSAARVRTYLQQRLPWYMVPTAVVSLPMLPLTPNGKLDHNALPRPAYGQQEPQTFRPQTPVEEVLAGIWSDLLHQEKIDVTQNFFDLGGHSLLATQVISRIRELFRIDFPLRALFEAPTVAELAVQVEQVLLSKQGYHMLPLEPVARTQALPLSFAQQRLWFLDQLDPGSSAYNIPLALRLEGALDITALERSLSALEEGHESLRTVFQHNDGQPVQLILSAGQSAPRYVDLLGLQPAIRSSVELTLVQQEARRPFDLSQGPLLRITILLLSKDEHILLLSLHHIISDGWSMEILVRDLFALYAAFTQGKASPLPELPLQYVDFASWQRRWLSGEVLNAHISYWQRQLAELPVMELPTDRPRPPMQTDNGALRSLCLSLEVSKQLQALSLREGTTLFMTLLAAFQALLARYSGQQDIAVGSPIANRNHAGVESLVGFFVNMLVLRTDLSHLHSFRDVLRQVRTTCLEAYTHQDLPFEQLVEILQPERDLSRSPLFQVLFTLHSPSTTQNFEEVPSLTISAVAEEQITAKFDLSLDITETPQGLFCSVEYNTDLFDAATMDRLLQHWQTLLEGVVTNPASSWRVLPLMKEEERILLLTTWGMTEALQPQCSIQELFEARASLAPEAPAVAYEERRLTYGQLNSQANQLAHYLQTKGVGPEIRVGICLHRSIEQVVALLAVLKAGGAYVPLDIRLPAERLSFMQQDADISILLTAAQLADRWSESIAHVLCLDTDKAAIAACSTENPPPSGPATHLAYIIYTSGSTGLPKGVMVTRANLANAYYAWAQAYQLTEYRKHLQMAQFSFDVFTGDVVRALCSGAELVLCPRDALLDPAQLYALMFRERIDCAEFVPAVLKNLVDYLEEHHQRLEFMRLLVSGSDNWPNQEYQRVQALCSSETVIFNTYGLTETTIDSTCFPAGSTPLSFERPVPVGRPLAGVSCFILDTALLPVPIGIAGEIYIGGVGVGRGYVSRADLTAERFIPDPFALAPGARLYKTGDLARYLPDGTLEYLDRIDRQVKLHGFRIELGEIEAVLAQHEDVRAAVALMREDRPGEQLLTAYIVPRLLPQDAQASSALLANMRQFLQNRIPDYMLPAAWMVLPSLPLTASDKVDYRALPTPESRMKSADDALITPVEEAVAHIWAELLDRDVTSLGRNAHFFSLGGHSLLATRVIARVRRELQVEIPLRTLFESPTVASFAEAIIQQEFAMMDDDLLLQMVEQLEAAHRAP